jgi:hypothetical protein
MNTKKEKIELPKVEEPAVVYESSRFRGIDEATFDFDEKFKNGLTPEQAKAESIRRIREWWEK